jgi:hypothetical protein
MVMPNGDAQAVWDNRFTAQIVAKEHTGFCHCIE